MRCRAIRRSGVSFGAPNGSGATTVWLTTAWGRVHACCLQDQFRLLTHYHQLCAHLRRCLFLNMDSTHSTCLFDKHITIFFFNLQVTSLWQISALRHQRQHVLSALCDCLYAFFNAYIDVSVEKIDEYINYPCSGLNST